MKQKTEWFQNWFDTRYYHLLYDYRNEEEAQFFMKNLIDFLHLEQGDSILDLPCGKGRHALFLSAQGFDVVGADLSENSIAYAKKYEGENLRFTLHDMREPLSGTYDAIFNLFTSFGYFEEKTTNVTVLRNFRKALRQGGHLVIDFLNMNQVREKLVPEQRLTKNGVDFIIKKSMDQEFIIKEIEVLDQDQHHRYVEKVQALNLVKMQNFADQAGLVIEHVFGDYALNPFREESSERLILVMR